MKGFYTGLGGFLSHSQHKQHENFWASVWVSSGFSGEFPSFPFSFSILCYIPRVHFGQSGVVKFVI